MRRAVLVSSPLLCFAVALAGALPAATDPDRWSVEDLVTFEDVVDIAIAPDATLAVFLESAVEEVDGEQQRVSHLWAVSLAVPGTEPWQLTRGEHGVSSPAFSPDGRFLAFLSDRPVPGGDEELEGKRQVWLLPLRGGEARPLTRLDRSVVSYDWRSPASLVVAAPEARSAWDVERTELSDTSTVVEDAEREPPVRLLQVDVPGGATRRLTGNARWIDDLAVSPDGRFAVVREQQSLAYEYDQAVPPQTYLVELETGATTRLFADLPVLPRSVRWTPDGAGFYFVDDYSRHPVFRTATVARLYHHEVSSGSTREVELGWERGLGGDYAATADGFVAMLADGVRLHPAHYRRDGAAWRRDDVSGAHARNLDGFELSRDGRTIVYRTSAATRPPQLWAARLEAGSLLDERKLTSLNPAFERKPTGRVEVVRWIGALGEEVEGLLHFPLDWDSPNRRDGERRPLILDIHGGPTGTDRDTWEADWHDLNILHRQNGAFVLQVNYHGSGGYGLDWVESIGGGKYYELEPVDIEAGVDWAIAQGYADPERLGISGWSNGAILTTEIITRTRRYKAAAAGAGDVEWISDWGNVDFGVSFDNYYFGASPIENPQLYIQKSPFFRLPQVTTPTIIFTGTEDRNVPPSQSWSHYRAMQQTTDTPVRLVLFPGEPHSLRKVAHQRRKLEEEVAWFERYLFEKPTEDRSWVKDGSPLAALLARANAAREGDALGVLRGSVLAPETVPFAGLEIGRFEVTRAQLRAFDASYTVAPESEELPASGISFEQAQRYVAWLSQHTGRRYRLPTKDEAERLARTAGSKGNTLERWAGYEPNPEDAARIRAALDGLRLGGAAAPLVLPVGSLPGVGDPAVFDLDGNIAEWATDGASGVAVGPSADRASDPRHSEPVQPDHAYVGLRVVLDP
ncbi:MAG TPA: prolyl oligopeptidase family serine peptidase [Thermoanaerobaculia bacterium]|nr:prolyl oligopeptidase family serine peptidase [Thermoanaerobaculia bacterium]